MELLIARKTIEVEHMIGENTLQTQVSAETATPGAGREAIEVLMEEADISVDTAEAQTDRVVVEGTAFCQAVYRQGEGSALRAVTAQVRFSEVVELEGVTPKAIVRVQGVIEEVEANYENGRMAFELIIALRVQALSLDPVEVIHEIGGVEGLETRFDEVQSSKTAAEASAGVTVREEVALPEQLDARVSLMDWSQVRLNRVASDLGGMMVEGEVQAEALIGTGVLARPVALVKVVMPFSQLVELPEWLTNDVVTDAQVTRLVTEVAPGENADEAVLKLEAEVDIEVRADAKDTVRALVDAYATGENMVLCEAEPITVTTGSGCIDHSEAFRGTLLLPEGMPGVSTVLATRVRPVISQWSGENGETFIEGALDVKALYLPGGSEQMQCVRGELPFQLRCTGIWPDNAWVRVVPSAAEAAALMNDRLEIRCTLSLTGFYRNTQTIAIARDAEQAPAQKRASGLLIHWPEQGETTWNIGKRYVLPIQKIADISGEDGTLSPDQPIVIRV